MRDFPEAMTAATDFSGTPKSEAISSIGIDRR